MKTEKPTHTPGPWEAVTDTVIDRNGTRVALIPAIGKAFERGEARGNARLIAAAPDMLAALQTTLDKIEKGVIVSTDPSIDIVTQIRAAIARAEVC